MTEVDGRYEMKWCEWVVCYMKWNIMTGVDGRDEIIWWLVCYMKWNIMTGVDGRDEMKWCEWLVCYMKWNIMTWVDMLI